MYSELSIGYSLHSVTEFSGTRNILECLELYFELYILNSYSYESVVSNSIGAIYEIILFAIFINIYDDLNLIFFKLLL